MKTLTPLKGYKRFQTIEIENKKVVRAVFVKDGKILTVHVPGNDTSTLPGFDLQEEQSFARQIQRFCDRSLGIQILDFCDFLGPVFFDPGLLDVDYYEIRIFAPNLWREICKSNQNLRLEWVSESDIFSQVDHLSRLCINEYWCH